MIPLALFALLACSGKADVDFSGGDGGSGGDTGAAGDGAGGPGDGGGGGWSESEWCADMADLSDLEDSYSPDKLRETLEAISERRYPPAAAFIEVQSDGELSAWFSGSDSDLQAVMDRYEVAVHEGSHIWDFDHLSGGSWPYRVVDDDHIIETRYLDNFDRSAILDRHPDPASDFYASTYLEGSSGAQGFNTLLDEYNAYTHSLATRYCTRDYLGGWSTSARDGILTMMFYVETYLAIAREEHPDDYDAILADPGHVDLILDVWDRAEHWLALSEAYPELGLDDEAIAEWVYDADNYAEIERLR
jgi:hypothetical protein